jgi:hypothetical protein
VLPARYNFLYFIKLAALRSAGCAPGSAAGAAPAFGPLHPRRAACGQGIASGGGSASTAMEGAPSPTVDP